jgi:hypothetical protein
MRKPRRNEETVEDRVGYDGLRYITGKEPDRTLDDHLRRDQQARIDAREGDPGDAGEWEVEAVAPPPTGDEFLVGWGEEEGAVFGGSDADVDVQGRSDEPERDWYGDPRADSGEPRMDEGILPRRRPH